MVTRTKSKSVKSVRYRDPELNRAVNAYARRMIDTRQTFEVPADGWDPPQEYRGLDIDEMEFLFTTFWSDKHWKYDTMRMRLARSRYTAVQRGNLLQCGVFIWNPRDKLKMFSQEMILSPFELPLTIAQWRKLIAAGLFKRQANWVWIPSVLRATNDDAWNDFHVYGWDVMNHTIPRALDIEEEAMVIGHDIIMNARDYARSRVTWKSASVYADITTPIFDRQKR